MKLKTLSEAIQPKYWIYKRSQSRLILPEGYTGKDLTGLEISSQDQKRIPKRAILNVVASGGKLTSLNGCPNNHNLRDLIVSENQLTSFEGVPQKLIGTLWIDNNKITSIRGIENHIHETIWIDLRGNPITGGLMSLFKIKGLGGVFIDDQEVEAIINNYLNEPDRDLNVMLDCQEELISKGHEEQAEL